MYYIFHEMYLWGLKSEIILYKYKKIQEQYGFFVK